MEFFIPMWVLMTPVVMFGAFLIYGGFAELYFWWHLEFDGAQVFRLICLISGIGLIFWAVT